MLPAPCAREGVVVKVFSVSMAGSQQGKCRCSRGGWVGYLLEKVVALGAVDADLGGGGIVPAHTMHQLAATTAVLPVTGPCKAAGM